MEYNKVCVRGSKGLKEFIIKNNISTNITDGSDDVWMFFYIDYIYDSKIVFKWSRHRRPSGKRLVTSDEFNKYLK